MTELYTMHGNKVVLLDRIELNILVNSLDMNDPRKELASKVLKRALRYEKKTNNPCMDVPARVSEIKKLFPNTPPRWRKNN